MIVNSNYEFRSPINTLKPIQPLIDVCKRTGAVIAGGYVNHILGGPFPGDIDIFTLDTLEDQFKETHLELERLGCELIHSTDWANTYLLYNSILSNEVERGYIPNLIQLIKPQQHIDTEEKLVNSFDFTIVSCWISNTGKIVAHKDWGVDNCNRVLKVTNVNYPVITMKRMFKYSQKGYSIPIEEMVKVMDEYSKCSPEKRTKEINRAGNQIYNFNKF